MLRGKFKMLPLRDFELGCLSVASLAKTATFPEGINVRKRLFALQLSLPLRALRFFRGPSASSYFQNSHHFLGGSEGLKTGKSSGRTAFIG